MLRRTCVRSRRTAGYLVGVALPSSMRGSGTQCSSGRGWRWRVRRHRVTARRGGGCSWSSMVLCRLFRGGRGVVLQTVLCSLFLVLVAACSAVADEWPDRIDRDGIGLSTRGVGSGVTLFFHDFLVAREVGEFILQDWDVRHVRRREIFRGPDLRRDEMVWDGKVLLLRGGSVADGMVYEERFSLLPQNRLDIHLRYRVALRTIGKLQVNLGGLAPYWVRGGEVAVGGGGGQVQIPTQWQGDKRVARGSEITIRTPVVDVSVATTTGDVRVSLLDRRRPVWRKAPRFLLHAGLTVTPSEEWEDLHWTVSLQPGSLTLPARDESPQAQPMQQSPAPAAFFDRVPRDGGAAAAPLPVRGQVIRLAPPMQHDVELFKRYLDAIARAGANTIVLVHSPKHVRLLRSGAPLGRWWTGEELEEIQRYAGSLGLEVVPGMLSKFSGDAVPGLPQPSGSDFYCVDDPRSYGTLFGLYQTLVNLYRPQFFLIAHDEIRRLAACRDDNRPSADLFVEDVTRIHNWLQARGIQTIMWGDMLLDHHWWQQVGGGANSGNPIWRSGDTAQAIEHLPKDIIILDWHYTPKKDYPSIGYFRAHGFRVWGQGWYDAEATAALGDSVRRYGGDGLLGADWGFWQTLSPAAMSLYAPAVGLDATLQVHDGGKDGVVALAEALRESPPAGAFVPVSLGAAANEMTADVQPWDGHGWFDLGPSLDLSTLPVGGARWGGVDFTVKPMGVGNGLNVVVVGGGVDHVDIPIQGQCQSLVFLHTAYVPNPVVYGPSSLPRGRVIGYYRIVFEEGPSEMIELREGQNVMDYRLDRGVLSNLAGFFLGVEELVGARVGWKGFTASGVEVVTHVLVWRNPTPARGIREVRVEAGEEIRGCRIALLALSALSFDPVKTDQ